MKALTKTDFNFPGQKSVYHGKVRDVYNINGEKLVMVATDRISAFDVVLPKGIPFKGQMLNQIAAKFLDATTDICPNWKMATPDPMVTVGVMCEGFPVEMIVRGYLCGSAWRAYKSGVREICGVKLPEGMKENQKFPEPIITPTTKAEIGEHDADISKEEILAQGLATPEESPSYMAGANSTNRFQYDYRAICPSLCLWCHGRIPFYDGNRWRRRNYFLLFTRHDFIWSTQKSEPYTVLKMP